MADLRSNVFDQLGFTVSAGGACLVGYEVTVRVARLVYLWAP